MPSSTVWSPKALLRPAVSMEMGLGEVMIGLLVGTLLGRLKPTSARGSSMGWCNATAGASGSGYLGATQQGGWMRRSDVEVLDDGLVDGGRDQVVELGGNFHLELLERIEDLEGGGGRG